MPNLKKKNLPKNKRKAIALLAKKEIAKRTFSGYVEYVHRGHYRHYRHTELVCNALEPIAHGEQKYIFIEMPPRHGKSMTVSESFPSYFIGRNPNKRVIVASYSDNLARKFGRMNRGKLEEYGNELFGVSLSSINAAQNNWGVAADSGGMIATGIGGSITGEGADLLIIDDPFKNAEAAASITIREKVWSEWESTLSTRLHKGASVVVIMTRWHEDDLIGRLLESSPHKWERLRLPAIAEDEDDLLGRKIGEPLCPELGFDKDWADLKKKEVGSRTWNALFQQRPSPAGGNIFKRSWWKFYVRDEAERARLGLGDSVVILPKLWDVQAQSWDCTFKDTKSSDYVVGEVWGRQKARLFLLDMVREQLNLPGTVKAIRNMSAKHPKTYAKWIEDKANGPAVIQTLESEIPGLIPVNPQGGKVVRANAISPFVEAGNVFLPHPLIAPWVEDFIEEATAFPNGKNDDMVDSMTQALNQLQAADESPLDRMKRLAAL